MAKGGPGEKTRGELGEIKSALAALSAGGMNKADSVAAKRDVFKRVINSMTIGVDMSSLFMQVMTCGVSNNEDLVLKKMLYLYICTYAQANPDLTLLTINLLTKDCRDQDPTIRGLALRSLCQLKVANLVEYLVRPLVA
jgi:vesicle coat complex subunit